MAEARLVDIQSPQVRRRPHLRFFFVVLSLVFVGVAALGFVPNQLDHLAGKLAISPVAQFHGGLMVVWLLTFVAQAVFVLQRRMGNLGTLETWGRSPRFQVNACEVNVVNVPLG